MTHKSSISEESLNIELKAIFESGETTYAKCSEVIRSKYKMGAERFTKAYHLAHTEWSELKKKAQSKVIDESETQRLKTAIIDKNEALEILSRQARGEKREVDGNIIVPSPSDVRGSIETIAKMEGWIAPTKSEVAITDKTINVTYTDDE